MGAAPAVLGLQGTFLDAERGVHRYARAQAGALHARSRRVVAIDLADAAPESVRVGLPPVPLRRAHASRRPAEGPIVYHVGSVLLDLHMPLGELWPRWARSPTVALTVMLYDLIVARSPASYLHGQEHRRFTARLEFLRQADGVLAISQAVADEAIDFLALRPERVHVIGAAAIVTTGADPDPRTTARSNVPGLRDGFVFAPLGSDPRKNSARLLRAFARLPAAVRSAHQLVITGHALDTPDGQRLAREAARLGIADDVLLPGTVSSAVLDALYRSCALVVFPSLDEGFGLPVAEGLAHGAAVIAADIPSIREIVPQADARFDPTDDAAVSCAMADALRPARLDVLRGRAPALAAVHTWERVADRTLEAWDLALAVRAARNRRARSTRPAERSGVALVSPLAPDRSGVARYSRLLGDALAERVPTVLVGSERRGDRPGAGALEAVLTMSPDLEPVVALGDSDGHLAPLLAFLRTGGTALLHDISMTHLAGLAAGALGEACDATALLALVARRANRILVHSDRARTAVLTVSADADVAVVPFGMARPAGAQPQPRAPGRPTVASFARVQHPGLLVDTFARVHRAAPEVRLVIAGPTWDDATASLVARELARAQIAHVVEGPRWWDEDEYAALLTTTTVAVQLRSNDRGEQSAAVGDALSCGLAVVCNDRGAHRDLPDGAVLKLHADAIAPQVAGAVLALLADPGRRARLGAGATRYADAHSFARAADGLLAALAG